MVAQEEDDELARARELVEECVAFASTAVREALPASLLRVGMKCGASDAFSGVTANPLVGAAADRISVHGGTVALSEVPEMFGAETILLNRSVDRETFEAGTAMINGFKRYYLDKNLPVYENPAPGNKEGGITTLEEKSMGCIRKGGNVPVTDVLEYGETLKKTGLSLVTAPGNDLVSITALAASGATILVFTTGRGNPLGSVIPTVKVSSTTLLADKKPRWIDFDAGPLLEGADMNRMADDLVDTILETASGRLTNSERAGYRDMAIWKGGVTV
jgi:altronate hydrolase